MNKELSNWENGNMASGKRVSVARLGEEVPPERAFGADATVDEVLAGFGVTLDKGETLAINGETVKGNDTPQNGETIYISPSTTGA